MLFLCSRYTRKNEEEEAHAHTCTLCTPTLRPAGARPLSLVPHDSCYEPLLRCCAVRRFIVLVQEVDGENFDWNLLLCDCDCCFVIAALWLCCELNSVRQIELVVDNWQLWKGRSYHTPESVFSYSARVHREIIFINYNWYCESCEAVQQANELQIQVIQLSKGHCRVQVRKGSYPVHNFCSAPEFCGESQLNGHDGSVGCLAPLNIVSRYTMSVWDIIYIALGVPLSELILIKEYCLISLDLIIHSD